MMDSVNIELLVVPGCANEPAAAQLLRTAMDEVGMIRVEFHTVTVADQATADRTGFPGSPTFMVDGVDLFHDPTRSSGLSCRLYPNRTGVAGVPELPDLRQALQRAVQSSPVRGTRAGPSTWTGSQPAG